MEEPHPDREGLTPAGRGAIIGVCAATVIGLLAWGAVRAFGWVSGALMVGAMTALPLPDEPLVVHRLTRTGKDVELRITVENTAKTGIDRFSVTKAQYGKVAAKVPLSFGKLAPGQKLTKTIILKNLPAGNYDEAFEWDYSAGSTSGTGTTGGSTYVP